MGHLVDITCRSLQELFRIALINFLTFVVSKILDNFVSMENFFKSKILKTVQCDATIVLNAIPECRIHFS